MGRVPVWLLLLAYWAVQPLIVLAFLCVFILAFPDNWWYGPPDISALGDAMGEPAFWGWILAISCSIAAAQAVMLIPVRKPGLTGGGGRSVRLTLLVGGLAWGVISFGLIWTVFSLIGTYGGYELVDRLTRNFSDRSTPWVVFFFWALIVLTALGCWLVPTVLLFVFTRPNPREGVMSRVANRLLLGTAAEALLVIPMDAMIRRKTECYCAEGSFFALLGIGAVGSLAAGPAMILPVFARRRRHWYRTHCAGCGYDMEGSMDAERCPECGRAWSPPPRPSHCERCGYDLSGTDDRSACPECGSGAIPTRRVTPPPAPSRQGS